jgi:hypothetical protein
MENKYSTSLTTGSGVVGTVTDADFASMEAM